MAEEDDWRPRLLARDQAIEGPEVADDLVPPAFVGEMPEICRSRLGPVAAMVVGVSRVARSIQRRGETGVAGAVLGEAMGDLHNCARRPFRQPAPRQKGRGHRQRENRIRSPAFSLSSQRTGNSLQKSDVCVKRAHDARLRSVSPNLLLAESTGIL